MNRNELDELLTRWASGEIDEIQFARLEAALAADPTARQRLRHHAMLDELLHDLGETGPGDVAPGTCGLNNPIAVPFVELSDQNKSHPGSQHDHPILSSIRDILFRGRGAMARAAAVLMIGSMCFGALIAAVAMFATSKTSALAQPVAFPIYVARLTAAHNLRFVNEAVGPKVDQLLAEGQTLDIASGFAEISFKGGARVVVEGPAAVAIQSAESTRLHFGKLVAEMPGGLSRFAVDLPTTRVVDFGSEFGVEVEIDGDSEVHVFAGSVEIQDASQRDRTGAADHASAKQLQLHAGEAIRMPLRVAASQMPSVDTRFVRKLGGRAAVQHGDFEVLAWYRLGENELPAMEHSLGPIPADSAGGRHLRPSGLLKAAPGSPCCGSNVSANFDGKTQLLAGDVLSCRPTDNFGIEAWVKPTTSEGVQVIAYYGDSSTNGWGLILQEESFAGLLGGATSRVGRTAIPIGRWTHLALVRADGVARLYVDGVAVGLSSGVSPQVPSGRFMIGAESLLNKYHFSGEIDEVRVFHFPPGGFDPQVHLSFQENES